MSTDMDKGAETESRDALCQKIDSTLLQFFSVLSQLYDAQAQLENQMKAGFLNLSRARYSMGTKFVSPQQYDENKMNASTKVTINDEHEGENDLMCLEKVSDQTAPDKTETDPAKETSSGLRQRKVKGSGDDNQTKIEEIDSKDELDKTPKDVGDSKSSKVNNTPFDPIKWFGVLVPPALRQGQKDFQVSIEKSVTLVNLRQQLVLLQKDYSYLLKLKKETFPEEE